MGGKPATSSSSSASGSAQPWANPYARTGASNVLDVYNTNQPGLQALTGQVNQQLTGLQHQGDQFGHTAGQASGFLGNVLGGQYLNSGNPQMQHVINSASADIRNSVGSMFEGAGRYGSVANQGEMAKQIGNMSSQLRYGDYNAQLDRMMGASEQANQANTANQQQQLAATGLAAQIPYTGTSAMADSLGALFNGGTEKSKSVGAKPGLLDYAMGAASSAAKAYAGQSERRVKDNIEFVATRPDGLNVYDFDYKPEIGISGRFRGVMVDEVEVLRPDALGPVVDGIQTVNYARL